MSKLNKLLGLEALKPNASDNVHNQTTTSMVLTIIFNTDHTREHFWCSVCCSQISPKITRIAFWNWLGGRQISNQVIKDKCRQYDTLQSTNIPDASLWSSRTKTSSKFGSQAHGTGWEQNRWPRKWTWTVSEESTSLSFRCSRNARPPLTWRNRCLRVGSMFAKNNIKVLSLTDCPLHDSDFVG